MEFNKKQVKYIEKSSQIALTQSQRFLTTLSI